MGTEPTLEDELRHVGLEFRESTDINGGLLIFAAKPFAPNKIIGAHYGYLNYDNLSVLLETDPTLRSRFYAHRV